MLEKIRTYMLPIAMLLGSIFYQEMGSLSFLIPGLVAAMLFITYCTMALRDIRITAMHGWLLLIQLGGSVGIYLVLLPIQPLLAQGALICIFAPTATSSVVVTKILGGNASSAAAYSLLSNIAVALLAPLLFAAIGPVSAESFTEAVFLISQRVFLLLLLPFVAALFTSKFIPKLHTMVQQIQGISFYLWALALMIITGKTILFILEQGKSNYLLECLLGLVALIVCLSQFFIGRKIGRKYNNTVAGGQGLGQKNTIIAIWMAQTYLNPLSSIAPSTYILWQNTVNSYQIWCVRKRI